MTTLLLSSAVFPPIDYFLALQNNTSKENGVIVDIGEHYQKQTYRNRYKILSYSGVQTLSIPVKKYPNHTPTKDIKIDNNVFWQKNHWQSLVTCYNNSAFFLYFQDDIKKFFDKKYNFLVDFNNDILNYCLAFFNIDIDVNFSEEYINIDVDNIAEKHKDFRDILHPKKPNIYNVYTPYIQTFSYNKFVENLSILDVIFNCGKEFNFPVNS
ncbi:hypothetical protein FACS1894153_2900 [Bacteroidia bacterium]|nr:hypothetical protein FACS1894153_2900 [Bacteroidia bacterium]